jgi:hypothetical protein
MTKRNMAKYLMTPAKEELIKRRFRRALRKHTILFFTQVAFSLLVAVAWWFVIWRNGWQVSKNDEPFFVHVVILLGSAAWVLKATEVLRVIWDQYREVSQAVKRADIATILDLKDEHVPLLMHFYIVMLALIVDGTVMFLPFDNTVDGFCIVFQVTLIFTFFTAIIIDLEDPLESGWIKNQLAKNCPTVLARDSEEAFAVRWQQAKIEFGLDEKGNADGK